MPLNISNSYLKLGAAFSQQSLPSPVVSPELLLWNLPLAKSLGIKFAVPEDNDLIAQYFSGNRLFERSEPIAQAYSGHQFGHFNPQLGDGRAHLLGDIKDENGNVWDIQLKGSGTSHFSRSGDGRCALGPALREFIMSEAMFALGVPTTRCLSVVATGQAVYREQALPGAVVTRVAASHIRVGTFQFFAARGDVESLKKLTRFAVQRHFPEITVPVIDDTSVNTDTCLDVVSSENVLDFFAAVLNKQVKLIVSWLRVGFIHGVMNTDNTAISGETIDYGPCAMMNHYHSDTVFSSIDRNARYAFGNQSSIMQWNMARLADCLLPLIDDDENVALAKIEPFLKQFANDLQYSYYLMMANKLGISDLCEGDVELVNDLLKFMQEKGMDYTQSFVTLAANLNQATVDKVLVNDEGSEDEWQQWLVRWYERIADDVNAAKKLMLQTNPQVIPRNHHVEAILATTQATGDLTNLDEFLTVLQQPYEEVDNTYLYQDAPRDGDIGYKTFCGT
ncbi:protein adenylyltransferase SelO [Colwellia sp. E2M01]|uniref:protein adenylyltransferase SelO n=1 Tax=Colwellia sp. E2M01 TaxID=2841561 RepID=UPI001C09FA8E|nr:YdiU family protein [Colwellia sp. E2M01]MBU2869794.1 YdiU family protein [Colwellia sp. E2M01]